VCVPNGGLVVANQGTANVVDLSGNSVPSGTLGPGDIMKVDPNSMVTINTADGTYAASQGSVVSPLEVGCYQSVCIPSPNVQNPDVAAQLSNAFAELGVGITTELLVHRLADALLVEAAVVTGVTGALPTAVGVGFTVYTVGRIGYETYQFIKTTNAIVPNALNSVQAGWKGVGTCEFVGTTVVCNHGTSLAIADGPNGTMVSDLTGSSFVVNLANMQATTLSAGQRVFVPSNSAASGQNLSQSVQSFDPDSVKQWWVTPSTSPLPMIIGGAAVAAVVAVAAAIVARRVRGRKLPPPPPPM